MIKELFHVKLQKALTKRARLTDFGPPNMCPFYTSPPKCIHVSFPICSCYSKSLPGHAKACVLMRETQEGMPKKSASLSKKIFFQLMAHRKRCLLPAFTYSPIYDEYRTQLAKVLTLPCKNGLPITTPMIPSLETVTFFGLFRFGFGFPLQVSRFKAYPEK